ncbi:DNA helicase [Chryseoglobus sp. 28M-23]|uniref:DNA helicase n=1 Tax=Chryseoglobus sp. 28M-23 TaxID=2772253 RepID=UPI001746815D|nr:DNA helicase [Chryseoglobus sp. 28M-23]QOD93690.1 DNA helicase [Chryseoglobus sp. 28M-23]
MGLSRKRRREIKKLRGSASDVWSEQREVLDHAAKVLRAASREAATVARDDVAPRVKSAYEKRIQPGIDAGVGSVRSAASATRSTFTDDVLPAVSGALGSAIAVLDIARNKQLRDALKSASASGRELATRAGQRVGLIEVKPKPGPGTYILIGLGVVAAAGVAYAAWQTLRADDDLWVEAEDDDLPVETSAQS